MLKRKQHPILIILTIAIILISVLVTLTKLAMTPAQAQGNASTLTPEQKDAICNPNNPASKLNPVNTTESRICGIPVTVKPHLTSSNMTTAAQAPPPPATSIAPSATPPS